MGQFVARSSLLKLRLEQRKTPHPHYIVFIYYLGDEVFYMLREFYFILSNPV